MKKNNKWRRRIIRVLENLLADLQRRPPGPTQSDVINKLAALSDRADSIMSDVDNVECADSLYYAKNISIPKTDESVLYRLKDCLEDTAFAIYCGMQDATYFRLFSARAWRDFTLGSIGIQTATFCTNNAHVQTELVSAQLRRFFDRLGDDNWITQMHTKMDMFMRRHIANDVERLDTHPDSVDPDFEETSLARNTKRRLGYYATSLLCSRLSTLLFQAFFAQRGSHPGDTLEQTRLLKSLTQLRCLEWADDLTSEPFKTDCMYEAARSLVLGHMDTDAVFAAQMLYDIQQQVDPQSIPLEDILEKLSLDYFKLYCKYESEWKEDGDVTESARAKRMLEQCLLLRHIIYSPGNVQDNLERWEYDTPTQYTVRRFNIVRHVPLLIGQMVAQHHEEFQDTFLDIANDRGHILAAIHLYNAAKNSGALPEETRWEDMEWVTDMQNELHLFGGSLADTDSRYLECFCRAYGLDQNKFSIGREPANPEQVKNDIHLEGSSPRRLESCARYVRACSVFRGLRGPNPREWRLRMMQAFSDCALDYFSAHGFPHSIGILIAAKDTHESDEEALCFDIFAFHTICHKLLTAIRRACFVYAPDDYPGIRYDDTEGLNTTIAEVLRDLLHCPRHHKRVWLLVVRLLGDVIKQEGSACIDMAFEKMKITTLDSIGMDSDDARSETVSSESVVSTPPPQSPKAGDSRSDVGESGKPNDETPATSERLKIGPAELPTPPDSNDSHDQNERFVNEILDMTVKKLPNGSTGLIASDGKVLDSWPSHGEESQIATKLIRMQRLLQECQEGRLTFEKLKSGDILFHQDGKPKVLVVMPAIEFQVLG